MRQVPSQRTSSFFFQALGNLYFAHTSLTDIKIWDFELKAYVDAIGKEVHSGNIEKVTTKEKAKFPQHFFPEVSEELRRQEEERSERQIQYANDKNPNVPKCYFKNINKSLAALRSQTI